MDVTNHKKSTPLHLAAEEGCIKKEDNRNFKDNVVLNIFEVTIVIALF